MVKMKVEVTDNEYKGIRRCVGSCLTIEQYIRVKLGLPILKPENDDLEDIFKAVSENKKKQ